MEIMNIIGSMGALAIAVVGVIIAISQLRTSQRDAHAARVAELSWQIYQTYDSSPIRSGRRAIEVISHKQPIPQNGLEYGDMYVNKAEQSGFQAYEQGGEDTIGGSVRRIMRFYHQVGILLEKGLIDPDFVFPLIGAGLDTSQYGIQVAADWYQNYYNSEDGHAKADKPRSIYNNAVKLIDQYKVWQHRQNLADRSYLKMTYKTKEQKLDRVSTDKPAIDEIYLRIWEKQQDFMGSRWSVMTFFLSISFALFGLSIQGQASSSLPVIATQRFAGLLIYWFAFSLYVRYHNWSMFLRNLLEDLEGRTSEYLTLQTQWKKHETRFQRSTSTSRILLYFGIIYTVCGLTLLWWFRL